MRHSFPKVFPEKVFQGFIEAQRLCGGGTEQCEVKGGERLKVHVFR